MAKDEISLRQKITSLFRFSIDPFSNRFTTPYEKESIENREIIFDCSLFEAQISYN